jgi:hypothetical protein
MVLYTSHTPVGISKWRPQSDVEWTNLPDEFDRVILVTFFILDSKRLKNWISRILMIQNDPAHMPHFWATNVQQQQQQQQQAPGSAACCSFACHARARALIAAFLHAMGARASAADRFEVHRLDSMLFRVILVCTHNTHTHHKWFCMAPVHSP